MFWHRAIEDDGGRGLAAVGERERAGIDFAGMPDPLHLVVRPALRRRGHDGGRPRPVVPVRSLLVLNRKQRASA